jgi:hypothetical protein
MKAEQKLRIKVELLTSYLLRVLNKGEELPENTWLSGFHFGNFSCHMVGFETPDYVLSLYRVLSLRGEQPEPETITLHNKGTNYKEGLWVRLNFHSVGDNWYESKTTLPGDLSDYCVKDRRYFNYDDGERICNDIIAFIGDSHCRLVSGKDLTKLLGWDR